MSKARELAELGNVYSDGALSNRNRIINGAMVIDQRNGGAAVVIGAGSFSYTADRWQIGNFRSVAGNLTVQQSSTAPANFRNSLVLTNGGAGAGAAADAVFLQHKIEGFNSADFGFGTVSAQAITVSFWVRSSVTGTYGVSVRGSDRSYIGSVTINQADTFEYKTLTVPAITSGTWNITNGEGLLLLVDLGIGTDNSQASGSWQNTSNYGLTGGTKWYLTNGATFYITGVQLEVGDTATPFEHRSVGQELALCQRYYIKSPELQAQKRVWNSSGVYLALCISADFPVVMRANPSMTVYGDISDGSQTTLGGAGLFGVSYGFSAFTNISNGAFVDMHYYIADAEL